LSGLGSGEKANPNRECGYSRRHKGSVLRKEHKIRVWGILGMILPFGPALRPTRWGATL